MKHETLDSSQRMEEISYIQNPEQVQYIYRSPLLDNWIDQHIIRM